MQDIDHFEFRSSKTGQLMTAFEFVRLNDSAGSSPEHIWVNCPTWLFLHIRTRPRSELFPFSRLFTTVFNTSSTCNATVPIGSGNVTVSVSGSVSLSTMSPTSSVSFSSSSSGSSTWALRQRIPRQQIILHIRIQQQSHPRPEETRLHSVLQLETLLALPRMAKACP